jgi:hypothetical protein
MGSEWMLGRLARVWIGFDWLGIGTGGELLWMRWWIFGFLRLGVSYTCCTSYSRHRWSDSLYYFFFEGVVGLVPKRGSLLFTLAYYAFPRWYEFGGLRWNYIDRGKPKNSEKNLSQCHFFYHKSHMDWRGRESGHPRWEAGD